MKKVYIAPSTEMIKTQTEQNLLGFSVKDETGKGVGSGGNSDGEVGEGGFIWADGKGNAWSSWEED